MSKINWLLRHTNPGEILLQSWLSQQGISKGLANKYAQGEWLKKLHFGVYQTPGDDPNWIDAINTINTQTSNTAWASGLTSLENQGLNHYIYSASQNWISFSQKSRIPLWFKRLFMTDIILSKSVLSISENNTLLSCHGINSKKVLMSAPELAILEVLNLVPTVVSFDHASDLFSGLVSLSPKKIVQALIAYDSVKVTRLCLYLAKHHNHSWGNAIDRNAINLGSGKRQIISGGILDHEFQITIPSHFKAQR